MDAPIDVLSLLTDSELKELQRTIDAKTTKNNPSTGCKEVIKGARGSRQRFTGKGGYPFHRVTAHKNVFRRETVSKPMAVHKIQYFLKTGQQVNKKGDTISHLCHRALCINPDHLFLEQQSVNLHRRNCKMARRCLRNHPDGHPNCIFGVCNICFRAYKRVPPFLSPLPPSLDPLSLSLSFSQMKCLHQIHPTLFPPFLMCLHIFYVVF